MKQIPLPDIDYLNECFYITKQGKLYWKERPESHFSNKHSMRSVNTRMAGNEAGTIKTGKPNDHRRIGIDGVYYLSARICFYFYHGWAPDCVNHIDKNVQNDRKSNLRASTRAKSAATRVPRCNNKTGIKGVWYHPPSKQWQAGIGVDGKVIYLGLFHNQKDAIIARKKASKKYYGEFGK